MLIATGGHGQNSFDGSLVVHKQEHLAIEIHFNMLHDDFKTPPAETRHL